MNTIVKKNIPKFYQRVFVNFSYWTIYQSLLLFLLYYYGKDVGIILSLGYLLYGFIHILWQQIEVLVSVKSNGSTISLEILNFNQFKIYTVDIKEIDILDKSHWIGRDIILKLNNFSIKISNDFYWKSKEIDELLLNLNGMKKDI